VAGDAVGVRAGGHQGARRLAVQALAPGAGQAVGDRAGDQVVDEAPGVVVDEPGGEQPVARVADLVERHARHRRDHLARRALADDGDRLRDRAVARRQLGHASAHDVARHRAQRRGVAPGPVERAHAMVGDLAAELAQQPRVAGRRPMALAADRERGERGGAADELRRAARSQRLGVQHGRGGRAADEAEQVRGRLGILGAGADGDEQRQVHDPPGQVGEHLQRRPVGPVRVVDDEHERRVVGQRRAQPQHAVGDRHGGVRAGHRPVEQQGAGRGGRAVEQARALLGRYVAQRPLQERAHDAESEVALERAGRGAAHATAGAGGLLRGVLEQRGLAEPGRRREDHDPAGAAGHPRHGRAQNVDLRFALDEQRPGAARGRMP
jgi:hypothetical protein